MEAMRLPLFPRIDRIGDCMQCRRVQVPLYRTQVAIKLVCRICLVKAGGVYE